MLSYIGSMFKYFTKNSEEDDDDKEEYLAEQLVELEAVQCKDECVIRDTTPEIPRNVTCFQRTGIITSEGQNYILIDGMLYFDVTNCSTHLNINDKVLYLGYKDANDSVIVVRILEILGPAWGEEENVEEDQFAVIEHVVVGEVDHRQDRFVCIKGSNLKIDLDNVEGTFVPICGDWLEILCTVQYDENKPADISLSQVLQVKSFKPLRSKVITATVTHLSGETGVCDRNIYFDKICKQNGGELQNGSKVILEAIESNQGTYCWRAIKMIPCTQNVVKTDPPLQDKSDIDEEKSLDLESHYGISFTHPIMFENVDFQKTAKLIATVTNNSSTAYILNKWIIPSKKRDSQVTIKPFLTQPIKLFPGKSFQFTIECCPKFLGKTKECLILMFKGFQIRRFICIHVTNDIIDYKENDFNLKNESECIEILRNVRKGRNHKVIPGVRQTRPPNFIPVRLGQFPIPDKIWSVVLGDSDQTVYSSEYEIIMNRIETNLPCLAQELHIGNYIDKWHTLLYMEEIQANINMRKYDNPKTFLIRCQEFLAIEIKGLSEKRPSPIKGDVVYVKDIWDKTAPKYEGCIHVVRGDLILMKFNPQFHETYSGSDVSLEFHFTRSVYRRAHQAVNLTLSNLGQDLLFPSRLKTRSPQVPSESMNKITWFNESLNENQKTTVTNIILGICRPLPYCIFGPPGTGKTVTVIETILQILRLLPESRILVAAPSNSAANLITERLLHYRKSFSDSMIRLIANYLLDSESIPEVIKPFCATLDIAREDTSKSKYYVRDGINLNCQTSFIGRHRVTIGTCFSIGTLAQMGLPQGHFTHVIIDETGQATEPEIMVPLTFIDKENGQIVLAGDPKQLGPVVMSRYCRDFGMDESYMERILDTFPYQKDYTAFGCGYNPKLMVQLTENYRSLEEVLVIPSEMFYNASLVPRLDARQSWISVLLKVMSEIFETSSEKPGGVFVYGIRGYNTKAEDSPSWFNPQEASMVALATCKLYKKNVSPEDIGIITPYIAQVKYIRVLFDAMGLVQPKIGSVEEFQGQERPIIIISTVRSSETLIQDDVKHKLGFVRSPKRFNVALTRAQVAVLLFCNPHLLSKDPLWNKVIERAVNEDKYTGCDLPECYNEYLTKNKC